MDIITTGDTFIHFQKCKKYSKIRLDIKLLGLFKNCYYF